MTTSNHHTLFKPALAASLVALVSISLFASRAQGEGSAPADTNDAPPASTTPTETSPPAPVVSEAQKAAGAKAFIKVASVLQSPRCMNCHPAGDAPLQTDQSKPHAFNITRKSVESGLECSTCHQEKNADALGAPGGPPGAPHWGLPEKEMPLVFEGRTPTQLCEQLKNPDENGHKTLAQLLEHVKKDPLVLWGWNPGGDRTKPPLAHEAFVTEFEAWVSSNGACP